MEKPYLTNYIDATRNAFQLDTIKETSYPALADLTPEVMARNQDTIQNIRLWDSRPLLQTFAQTQAIRLYYSFYDVATDRYHLADGYHQVMLSARELSNELPAAAQTWVNQYLQFTHGYGLVMNFVSKTVGGGFPQYLLENVPAQSAFGLKIDQPSVYYGKSMPGYRIVDTDIKEFDYPKGNDNVYTSYAGTGGIPLGQPLEACSVRLEQGRHQHSLHQLPQAGESHSNPQRRARARRSDRALPASRQRSLSCAERGQAVLDTGCLHGFELFSLFEPASDGSVRGAKPSELHLRSR